MADAKDPKVEPGSLSPEQNSINSQIKMIKMMKMVLIAFIVILLGIGGMFFYFLNTMSHAQNNTYAQKKVAKKSTTKDKEHKENDKKEEQNGSEENSAKENKEDKEDKEGHADKTEGTSHDEDHEGASAKPLYYKFTPSIVTSIVAKDQMRYLRVDVELVSKDKTLIDNISTYAPIIRNELTNLFSAQPYEELILPQTKDVLRKKVSDSVKKILKENTGQDNIDSVLFTTFIIQ